MDKSTGKPALDPEGNQITGETEFRAITTSGRVKVIFEFDATGLFGKDTVVFEIVFDSEGHIAAKHEEIDDEGQTVTWEKPDPKYEMYKIRTTKAPTKGDKFGFFRQDEVEYEVHVENTGNIPLTMDVTDKFTEHAEYFTVPVLKGVKLSGNGTWNNEGKDEHVANITLEPGEKATVTYTAKVKEEAKEYLAAAAKDSDSLDADGNDTNMVYQKNVTDDKDGYWNEAACENVTYPNPEKPDEPGKLEPKKDVAQTPVQEPVIRTTASVDGKNTDVTPKKEIKLTDVIEYEGFKSGEYTVSGRLMDKVTGKVCLDAFGNEITAEKTVSIKEPTGKLAVEFTFDASALFGHDTVVFEKMVNAEGKVIAVHEDLNDKAQTVTWEHMKPSYEMYKIRTTKAPSKGDKFGFFVQDEVEYEVHVKNTGNIALTMDVTDHFTQNPEFFSVPKLRGVKFTGNGTWNNKGKDERVADITLEPGEKAVVTFSAVISDNAREYLAAKAKDSDSKDASGHDTNKAYQKNETDDKDGYRNTAECENVTYPNPDKPDEPRTLEPKDDEAQTPVQKPELGTTLTGNKKAKEVDPCEETELTDVVDYKGFDPSKWYMVKGTLMMKDSGDPLVENGYEVTVWSEPFRPGKESGRIEVAFMIDTTNRKGNYMGTPPTLQDFRDVLLQQPEPEAHELALELELFTRGSLNTFAKQTNVDTSNSLICYDIFELGEQLRAIGMLVILDSIMNRIAQNREKGKKTFIYIDEIYLLFMHEYSAQFLYKLWKRVRKYGAYCTGITQNVSDLLQSYTARTMLSNSEFIVMLNQAASDRIELAKLLNISEDQLNYITNVEAGHGLMKIGSNLVPFENDFPKNTELYKLMTSKVEEVTEFRQQEQKSGKRSVTPEEEAEFKRRIMEVARNNEGFSDLVDRYLRKDE